MCNWRRNCEVIYGYSKRKETINAKSKKTKIYQEKQTLVVSKHLPIEIRTDHGNETSVYTLSLGPQRKCKCYNGYFVNGYVFHTEEYGQGKKTYNNGVCVKGSTSSELEVDYYGRLEEVVELQYHNEQNIVFLFKCYWYDMTDRGIRVDPHYGLVEINSKARLRNVNNVFVFAKQCQQVYYTYTPSFRKDRSRVDWLSVLKTKPRGRVEVVQDENEDTSV